MVLVSRLVLSRFVVFLPGRISWSPQLSCFTHLINGLRDITCKQCGSPNRCVPSTQAGDVAVFDVGPDHILPAMAQPVETGCHQTEAVMKRFEIGLTGL